MPLNVANSEQHVDSLQASRFVGADWPFRAAEDPAARRLLRDVRAIERNGRAVFPRPMLVRIDPRKHPEDFGEMELLRVRGLFPDQTLYTLQVEVWSDFGTGELSASQVRARAEEVCARLRREGWTAYVHHEVDRVISSVTVGLYDNRSIDAESGLDLCRFDPSPKEIPTPLGQW